MRVLLTGGAGFIGSHLADRLVALGHQVRVLDDLSTGSLAHLEQCANGLQFEQGSVLDADRVERLLEDCDRVVHLASTVGVDRVARDPEGTRQVIVNGSRIVLDRACARRLPVLLISSSEVYGFAPPLPIRETDVLGRIEGRAPRLAYARAKLAADQAARALYAQGLPVLSIRPFNVVGPRQAQEGGAVLPRFVEQAIAGQPLSVHGDGLQQRTFLDVRDLSRVLADLVRRESFPVDAVNLGGTEECSISNLAEQVVKLLDSHSGIRRIDPPATRGGVEVRRRVPDLGRLSKLVEFRPTRALTDSILALAEERLAPAGTA